MSRITPTHWRTLVKVFGAAGFHTDRIAGSHVIMTKPGVARAVVVPKYPEVGRDIILSKLAYSGHLSGAILRAAESRVNGRAR